MTERDIKRASSIVAEFCQNAVPSDLVDRVQEEIMKQPDDDYWFRVGQDWSVLGHQVIGAEEF